MFFKSRKFIGSFTKATDIPKTGLPEFAFAGRSNVGKSSLINFVAHVKNLAKVSQTPGKTQLINYFLIDEEWYLVDLPGYGFTKGSKSKRSIFQKMIDEYLAESETLKCVFLLIDSRIPPQESDLAFADQLGEWQIPFVLVFTKADKYPSGKAKANIEAFKDAMSESWDELPQMFVTSSKGKMGREEIVRFIDEVLKKNTE